MFGKQAVCISTAAGSGLKSTIKDMADSTFFWGVGRTYSLGVGVAATSWDLVSPKVRARVEKKTTALAEKIQKRAGHVVPSLKTKAFFNIMRMMQKNGWNEADVRYWEEMGWLGKMRPWKNQ